MEECPNRVDRLPGQRRSLGTVQAPGAARFSRKESIARWRLWSHARLLAGRQNRNLGRQSPTPCRCEVRSHRLQYQRADPSDPPRRAGAVGRLRRTLRHPRRPRDCDPHWRTGTQHRLFRGSARRPPPPPWVELQQPFVALLQSNAAWFGTTGPAPILPTALAPAASISAGPWTPLPARPRSPAFPPGSFRVFCSSPRRPAPCLGSSYGSSRPGFRIPPPANPAGAGPWRSSCASRERRDGGVGLARKGRTALRTIQQEGLPAAWSLVRKNLNHAFRTAPGGLVRLGIQTFRPSDTPTRELLLSGQYESPERRACRRYIRADLPVVEFGACLGVVACSVNRRLKDPRNHVVVEANPHLLPILAENRDRN